MPETPLDLPQIVAANITQLRKEAGGGVGLTVRQFADLIGVSKATVSSWATGGCDVPLRRLEKIAHVLSVPVARLFEPVAEAVPAPPVSLGQLREAIVAVMDLGGSFGANMHEDKDVLIWDGALFRRLSDVQPTFHNGRFAFLLTAGALDPESGTDAWWAERGGRPTEGPFAKKVCRG